MPGPTMPEIMTASAARVRQVPGFAFGSVEYPQSDRLGPSPIAILRDGGGSAGPALISRSVSEGQEWIGRFTVRILVPSQRETPREETKIDALIAPVVDAFDPTAWGGVIGEALPGISGHVDAINPVHYDRGATEYAGQFCYAADIVFEARFTRYPDLIPLE